MVLLVVVAGPARTAVKMADHLKNRLSRRGFCVQSLRNSREMISSCSDIVLVVGSDKESDRLAQSIEQKWTEQWQEWFAANRASPTPGPLQEAEGRG